VAGRETAGDEGCAHPHSLPRGSAATDDGHADAPRCPTEAARPRCEENPPQPAYAARSRVTR
jgi:hypothetical protein